MASIIKADTLQSTTANVFVLNSSGTEYARFDSTGAFQLANPTTFPAGTALLPSITATGDTNTGLYFPAADTIAFTKGGAEAMRIDSSGNVKLSAVNTKILNSSGNPILQQTGSVLQVVSVNKVDTFSTATHGSWVDITGMAASITPTSTSSKILVMVQLSIGGGGNNYGRGYGVKRGATQLNLGTYGTGSPGSFGASTSYAGGDNGGIFSAPFIYLDSPSTTSSTTYQVELFADSRSVTNTLINRTYAGTNDGGYGASTITLMEIAA